MNQEIKLKSILSKGKLFNFRKLEQLSNFPDNGIYIMTEKSENNRVTRVGINLTNSLEHRLSTHKNGSRRNSVFRKHLYRILGSEDSVSDFMLNNVEFYIIKDPENRRVDLEKKLIAHFSKLPDKKISKGWKGLESKTKRIESSGLWNVHYVFGDYDLTADDIKYIEKNIIKTTKN